MRRILIVAGGPSARSIDISSLTDPIIAVNSAVFHVPNPIAVVSIDRDWIDWNDIRLCDFQGERFLMRREGEDQHLLSSERCPRFTVAPGLSDWWSICHTGGCSGYAALNLAYLMRPESIGLIGFDYDATGRHFFDNEARLTNSRQTWARWAAAFDTTVEQFARAGIEVVNYNLNSAVSAFPRADPRDLCQ